MTTKNFQLQKIFKFFSFLQKISCVFTIRVFENLVFQLEQKKSFRKRFLTKKNVLPKKNQNLQPQKIFFLEWNTFLSPFSLSCFRSRKWSKKYKPAWRKIRISKEQNLIDFPSRYRKKYLDYNLKSFFCRWEIFLDFSC